MDYSSRILTLAASVKLAIFDVDGVMTDGQLLFGPDGREYKSFHVRDGLGLKMLGDAGIKIAVITGRESSDVAERMAQLGIDSVFQGQSNKLTALETILTQFNLTLPEICYVGDDLPDLPVLMRVGLPIAVADAHWKLHDHVACAMTQHGGDGAVHEVCELLLTAKDKLGEQISKFENLRNTL